MCTYSLRLWNGFSKAIWYNSIHKKLFLNASEFVCLFGFQIEITEQIYTICEIDGTL